MTIATTGKQPGANVARMLPRSPVSRAALIQWTVAGVTLVLVVGPLIPIFYQSLLEGPLYDAVRVHSLDNYFEVFSEPSLLQAVQNTFTLAFLNAFISTGIGVALAILIGRTNMPARRLFGSIAILPIMISHLVLAFGWFMSYGPAGYVTMVLKNVFHLDVLNMYSMAGIALILGVAQAPLTYLYCSGSTALADQNLEDAARTCGAGPGRALWTVTLPLMMPAIAYSAALSFASGLETLSMPLIFGESAGIRFLSTILFTQGMTAARPNQGLVAAIAVILVILGLLLIYVQRLILRNANRYVSVGGKASRPRVFDIGPLRWIAFGVVFVYLLVGIVIPLLFLMLRSLVVFLTPMVPFWNYFTTRFYVDMLIAADTQAAIWNTLFVAGVGGVIAVAYMAVLAAVIHRSSFPFRRQLEYLALIPRAVPGIVAGVGIYYAVLLFPSSGWLRNTLWLIIIAYVMRYLPTAYGSLSPSILAISKDLDNSARIMGADWWTATYNAVLRLVTPAILACFTLVFILFYKEYSIAVYLFGPNTEVLGTKMLRYFINGQMGNVAALSVFQVITTLILVFLTRRLLGVKIHG
jgi:iron(III) transport system permease protein